MAPRGTLGAVCRACKGKVTHQSTLDLMVYEDAMTMQHFLRLWLVLNQVLSQHHDARVECSFDAKQRSNREPLSVSSSLPALSLQVPRDSIGQSP